MVLKRNILNISNCSGCGLCKFICPVGAIYFKEDQNGFLKPLIKKEDCINCGLCYKNCIQIKKIKQLKRIDCYASWSKDSKNLKSSSSGGLFFEIAKIFINSGDFVCGSIMQNSKAKHILTNNIEIVKSMRGSKYIQSDTSGTFKSLLELNSKKKILFIGTPCQVKAVKQLYAYHKKDLRNLFTCDIFCYGVPSSILFDSFIKSKTRKNKKIINLVFRDKSYGWKDYCMKIEYSDKSSELIKHHKNPYMESYLSGIFLRDSCFECKFNEIPRYGDISLGDFWGVPKEIENFDGTSAVIINSQKGKILFDELILKKKINYKCVPFNIIKKYNPRLNGKEVNKSKFRYSFIKLIKIYDFNLIFTFVLKPYILILRVTNKLKRVIKR